MKYLSQQELRPERRRNSNAFWTRFILALACVALALAGFQLHALARRLNDVRSELKQVRSGSVAEIPDLAEQRRSVCFIHAAYVVKRPAGLRGPREVKVSTSGTGFVVESGAIATSAHVLMPEFNDATAERYIAAGARPEVERLVAFFPGKREPVQLHDARIAAEVDIAVARFRPDSTLKPLKIAGERASTGEAVVVLGYPLGVAGLVAKSPSAVYERLALRTDDVTNTAQVLSHMALIRPFATFGRLGDVVGDKLVYDAATAHGGSGGPVLNVRGEVVGINAAYIRGFDGGSVGVSATELKRVLESGSRP